jgi:hypothetical protein
MAKAEVIIRVVKSRLRARMGESFPNMNIE